MPVGNVTAELRGCFREYVEDHPAYTERFGEHVQPPCIIWGRVYGDIRGRFRNGDLIHTSLIVSFDETTQIVTTLNSTYRILNWIE